LPVTPKWKLSGTARYTVESGSAKYYGQVNAAYQGSASSDIRVGPAAVVGRLPAFTVANLAFGAEWDKLELELFVTNLFDERGQISRFISCGQCTRTYAVPTQPRTFGVRAGIEF
jgi:outer membrane receptor protein involved in Fe transport